MGNVRLDRMTLNAHAGTGRLDIMAACAAPVQISFIGYPNTTGLDTVRVCCRVLQGVAGCCSVSQGFVECCSALLSVAQCSRV